MEKKETKEVEKVKEEVEDATMFPSQCIINPLCIRKPDFISGKHRSGCVFADGKKKRKMKVGPDSVGWKVAKANVAKANEKLPGAKRGKADAIEVDVGSSVSTAGGSSRNDAIAIFAKKWADGEITKEQFDELISKLN